MKTLYPEIEPYAVHAVEVDDVHSIYVEECGNPAGIPVVFLHGGPASGCKLHHRRFFNPEVYRIILFDQRGCGRSKPHGELENNTTQALIMDIESLRIKFGIDKWLLFGGSWGATLSLLYAQAFPNRVSAMILRGIFLARRRDFEWFLLDGANRIYPEQWSRLVNTIPVLDRQDLLSALNRCLWGEDELAQLRIAKEWDAWGGQVALGSGYNSSETAGHVSPEILRQVRVEMHFAKHQYFIEENQIMASAQQIPHVPTIILHGRNDLVCPLESGYEVHQKLSESEFVVLPDSGHVAHGDEMVDALVDATDRIAPEIST